MALRLSRLLEAVDEAEGLRPGVRSSEEEDDACDAEKREPSPCAEEVHFQSVGGLHGIRGT